MEGDREYINPNAINNLINEIDNIKGNINKALEALDEIIRKSTNAEWFDLFITIAENVAEIEGNYLKFSQDSFLLQFYLICTQLDTKINLIVFYRFRIAF